MDTGVELGLGPAKVRVFLQNSHNAFCLAGRKISFLALNFAHILFFMSERFLLEITAHSSRYPATLSMIISCQRTVACTSSKWIIETR